MVITKNSNRLPIFFIHNLKNHLTISVFAIYYFLFTVSLNGAGGGPDNFGYIFTDTSNPLEPDAPRRPSDEAKQIAQLDPTFTECVQNANTLSFFRCLTIAGSPTSCRIGAGIGLVPVCPTSDVFQAFDESIDNCFAVDLSPQSPVLAILPNGNLGFGFTFYGQVAQTINICPLGFITINAPDTFTGVNVITTPSGGVLTELIEKKFPNIDDSTTTDLFEGFPETIAAYYTLLDASPDAAIGGSGVYLTRSEIPSGTNNSIEVLIIEYNNVIDTEGNRSTFQILLFGRVFDVTDPANPFVVDEVDLIVVKYERAVSDNITFRLAGINANDGLNGLTWNSGIFDVFDTAVAYVISLSPPPSKLFVNDSIRGAQSGFEGNPVTITTFFPVMSAIFEGRRCEKAFAAKIQFATDPNFTNIICTSDVINFPVEIQRFIRSPNINPSPCQGQVAFKPFVQYYWRIAFWKRGFPQDANGNCDFAGTPGEPDRTLYTSTRIAASAKPNSFIICNTCSKSGTGSTLGLPGGDSGGSQAVIGSFTGQGTGGSSGGSCAIATASLNNENKLIYFRLTRDRYITQTSFGKKFVKTYYKFSGNIANLIKNSKIIKLPFQFVINAIYSYISFIHNTSILIKLLLLILFCTVFTTYQYYKSK